MADVYMTTNESILDEPLLTTESPAIDSIDLFVLLSLLIGAIAYLSKSKLRNLFSSKDVSSTEIEVSKEDSLRSIAHICNTTGKNCVIFYGSQTGTAENYAQKLAREASSRYGLDPMVADLEEYDYNGLSELSEQVVLMFVLATYGEGEPTDNAQDFYSYITGDEAEASLKNVKYVAFGLGNSTYEHYNAMVRRVSKAMDNLGARNLARIGEADDATGTTEEDFLSWKQDMWPKLVQEFGLKERDVAYESSFGVIERDDMDVSSPGVYLGEANADHLESSGNRQFSNTNPYIANITESREVFTSKDRNCIHMEIDLGDSGLAYETGDHVAIWPSNSEDQVTQLLNILGLREKKDKVISIVSRESTAKSPVPTLTTYATALRYYLEIAGPVSREFINIIAAFAPNGTAKAEATKLGSDKEYFNTRISQPRLTLALVLKSLSNGQPWAQIPFSAIIEGLNKLQPRYYSTSSSSLVQPTVVSITAAVEACEIPSRPEAFRGVATNYLQAIKKAQNHESPLETSHLIDGPRAKYSGFRVPVHLRKSNFKLPKDTSRPVIMIGPGTGVAPFRAFVQERAALKKQGKNVGKNLLFFGCRRRDEDYLYESEWKDCKNILGDAFDIHIAFSRETKQKVYVQHMIKTHAKEVVDMIENGAIVYVCGDAKHMARDVNSTLISIWAEQRGFSENEALEKVKSLRENGRYQEDIW
ncbi:NADPH-ferrihemoprotein reductase [Fusarium austroafricanum]|uniref:NADPH--cytochrome P450 reductase n=1 Tax=Fusarium austroafricanum TaxID=2364996 RepID=A0A8H4K1E7_9HYPO|nr:NADPH-ferrihemoprotein reductase [Fusarium austroafricanum]